MSRARYIVAIALTTAGVVVLSDVAITLAYKEPLSSIYSSIKQDEAASELGDLEARFRAPADRATVANPTGTRERIAALAGRFASQVGAGKAIGRILAPAMDGLDMVVVQGTNAASLRTGPGHYPETRFPGQGGTVAIAGHRTTYLAPFRHIDSMRSGDTITLEMPYGRFTYRVRKTAVVDPSDVGVVRDVGYERLVLSACNPLYSADQRFIVFARLVVETPTDGR